jgi:hypothetical protein
VTVITYTGTAEDYKLLLAEGNLDAADVFETVSVGEVRARVTAWVLLKTRHTSFWHGYETASADAAAAPRAVEKPSLVRRLVGWLAS